MGSLNHGGSLRGAGRWRSFRGDRGAMVWEKLPPFLTTGAFREMGIHLSRTAEEEAPWEEAKGLCLLKGPSRASPS